MAPKAKLMITWNGTDRDEGLRGGLLTDTVDNAAQYASMDGWQRKVIQGDAGAPQSQMATGRACPGCAGQLLIREMSLSGGVLIVYCKQCGKTYNSTDLETQNATTDTIFRQIPDDLILRYMKANEVRLKQDGTLPMDMIPDSTIATNISPGVKSTMPLNGPLNP